MIDFVDYVDGEIEGAGFLRGDLDASATEWVFTTAAKVVTAMRNVGFEKGS